MLLPALSKAKSKAQQAHCTSNFKQLAYAIAMYSADFNDHLPGPCWSGMFFTYQDSTPSDPANPDRYNGSLAAYLTKTLRMFTRIVDAVGDWAVNLAWNPTTWAGIVVAGVSGVLFVVSGALRSRGIGRAGREPRRGRAKKELPAASAPGGGPIVGRGDGDDEMAEIEALLRKRGIS